MVLLFDQYNLPDDFYEVIFATEQQVHVAKMLIDDLKNSDGVFTKTQMSEFATNLHDGIQIEVPINVGMVATRTKKIISYNKRQFYDRILTPMKSMGLIDYDLYKKVYKLSNKFASIMDKIGHKWAIEARK